MPIFEHSSAVPYPPGTVFTWHGRPLALERLMPPWESFRVERRVGGIQDGGEVWIRQRFGGVWFRWHSRHHGYVEGEQFIDEALEAPFPRWKHTHTFPSADQGGCLVHDKIEYGFPAGRLGEAVLGRTVRRKLQRAFRYRHETLQWDLARHAGFGAPPLRILISGASGLLGRNLAAFLSTGGHEVHSLVRRQADPSRREIAWDPAAGRLDRAALEGFDAVVHLAGESLDRGRWTAARKREILESRRTGTRLLSEGLASVARPPRVLLSASAVGWYGDRGDEILSESSEVGHGFLSEVAQAWEAAAEPARQAGIRVVHPRTGVVLSPNAGLLRRLLPVARLGLGPRLGDGRQWVSWVSLDDVLYAFHSALTQERIEGPVNVTSPNPVRSADLMKVLGRVLRRPSGLPAPRSIVTAIYGEQARDGLFSSARAIPAKLTASGFRFASASLDDALRRCLGLRGEKA